MVVAQGRGAAQSCHRGERKLGAYGGQTYSDLFGRNEKDSDRRADSNDEVYLKRKESGGAERTGGGTPEIKGIKWGCMFWLPHFSACGQNTEGVVK